LSNDYNLKSGWNEINIEGIKLHILHSGYSNQDSYLKRVLKFLNFSVRAIPISLKVKADVVFVTSTPLTIAIPGVIYSKLKKIPMVFEVRDLWPELPIAVGAIKNRALIYLAKKLERFAYNNATRLIGLSPGMCDGIARQGIDRNSITLATNSCDTQLFDVDEKIGQQYINDMLPYLNGRKLVVYTGTFGVINDVSYLVHLAKACLEERADICFVAIGSGMQKDEVIDLARSKGVLGDNLHILEPVAKTEIVKLLSAADLSLSLFGPVQEMWHNSANKLFDALASQTPIAVNYGGWQKKFIIESGCGLALDSNNYAHAARAIRDFLGDESAYEKAKEACKDLAYNYYSRDIMASRVEKTLQDAVKNEKTV
jgi:glycosyltransferase involved in cell wall biosynthesis